MVGPSILDCCLFGLDASHEVSNQQNIIAQFKGPDYILLKKKTDVTLMLERITCIYIDKKKCVFLLWYFFLNLLMRPKNENIFLW